MDSKERVLRAVNRQETDRVPVDFTAVQSVVERLKNDLSVRSEEALMNYLQVDLRRLSKGDYTDPQRYTPDGEPADFWGIKSDLTYADSLGYRPLAAADSVDDIYAYSWPHPDHFDFSLVTQQCRQWSDFAVRGSAWAPIFCQCCDLCGMETMLYWLAAVPEMADAILDCVTEVYLELNKRYFEASLGMLDICYMGDDYGTQNGMLISPETWRRAIKPRLARLYSQAKEYGLVTMHHSCGGIAPIIADLIEIGVDVLNPIQVRAVGMDPAALKLQFGDRLAFHGGVDTQETLPHGTQDDVRDEVRGRIAVLGEGGGYILTGTHDLLDDIPTANILAMYDEAVRTQW